VPRLARTRVESLADLISREISPEPGLVKGPAAHRVDVAIPAKGTETPPNAFHIAVFNFLVEHKRALAISAVWQCRNVRIDGLLDLDDGRRIALEIKYRMNWQKACQACAQFGWYRTYVEAKEKPLSSGLVVFETFTGDWSRKKPNSLLENGWNFFYTDHREVEGLRVHLVRLRDGTLESFPTALAAVRAKAGASAGLPEPGAAPS
jgi:hypothetical protein